MIVFKLLSYTGSRKSKREREKKTLIKLIYKGTKTIMNIYLQVTMKVRL
jgi:hypothetical protein